MQIRCLGRNDAVAYREIRLEALRTVPEAFGSSFEAEKDRSVDAFTETVERSYVAGGFVDDRLAGMAGYYRLTGDKLAHRGNIWGVYVRPEFRGSGLARALLENVLGHARSEVIQVHLSVVAGNEAALRLYRGLGFIAYGNEPRSLKIGSDFHDEHLMVLRFDDELLSRRW